MDKYKFGEFIYKRRKELGLTQDELGRKLYLTNKAVSKWETGESLPEVTMLPDLASILEVTVDELLTQVKPEVVYKERKKTPIIILSVLLAIVCVWFIVYAIIQNLPTKTIITEENYTEFYNITLAGSSLDGTSLKVLVNIKDLNVSSPSLKINCTVTYYYTRCGIDGEITYTDRFVEYDGTCNDFYLELSPAYEIEDFTFVGYDISYSLVSVEGEIVR